MQAPVSCYLSSDSPFLSNCTDSLASIMTYISLEFGVIGPPSVQRAWRQVEANIDIRSEEM